MIVIGNVAFSDRLALSRPTSTPRLTSFSRLGLALPNLLLTKMQLQKHLNTTAETSKTQILSGFRFT
jgi:hypothetical protein